ncbi:MAG: response regulator [Deltaproteobacteria bacterium]|nr:response regulator [Candidatus Tharpella aukensis]
MAAEKKHSVLFVDDEQRVLKSLKRGLIGEPYRALFAISGMEALEILAVQPVQVIVSDMKMPEMNGLELLQEVGRKYPDVIRMVLSGYSHTSTVLAAVNEGRIFRYITKPWSIDNDIKPALAAAVERFERREEERGEAKRLQVDNLQLQGKLDDGRKTVSQTKKVASEIYLRKTNSQRRSLERLQGVLNYVSSQAINLEMGEIDEESRKLVVEIKQVCREALEGLEKVYLLNALEVGEQKPVAAVLELPQFFAELNSMAKRRAEAIGLTIIFQAVGELPERVVTDAELLRAMIWEILENALQNSPSGGIVVCNAESQEIAEGVLRLTVTIRDTGSGIEPAKLKELQQPFVCGASGGNRHSSWGVGLSLARLIASKLGGSMKIGGSDQGCQVVLEVEMQAGSNNVDN